MSNEDDSDWYEEKRKQLKKTRCPRITRVTRSMEVEKGKDPNAPRKACLCRYCGSMLAERRSSQTILASVPQIFTRRQTRSGRECPMRMNRSGMVRVRIPEGNMKKP